DSRHYIAPGTVAGIAEDRLLICVAEIRAAAIVRLEHDETLCRQVLRECGEADRRSSPRPAVNLQDQRILLTRGVSGGVGHDAVFMKMSRPLPVEAFRAAERELIHPAIEIRQAARLCVRGRKIIQLALAIVGARNERNLAL